MVEQEAVNFEVAGSSPVPGARIRYATPLAYLIFYLSSISKNGLGPSGASPFRTFADYS